MTNQLHPIEPPFTPEVAALLARYPQQDGQLLSLFRTFANSPRFLRKGVPNLLDRDSPLPLRVREIVILRVTGRRRCAYEWGVHVAIFARAARLTPDQAANTWATQITPALWSAHEADLLRAIDALLNTGHLSGLALATFTAGWTQAQQLEIMALAGAYQTISFVANVAGLPPETFAASVPG